MKMTINEREFNIYKTSEHGVLLTYIDKQLEREYVLIRNVLTTKVLVERLERYATMSLNELRNLAPEEL